MKTDLIHALTGTFEAHAQVTGGGVEHPNSDHFVDVNRMVDLGSGSQRDVDDIMLTRYACYLIAQNGDPIRPAILPAAEDVNKVERRLASDEKKSLKHIESLDS